MKRLVGVSLALALLGASLIWWGHTRGALENSEPVRLPYPGTGFQLSDTFRVASGGRFALQIGTPVTAAEVRQLHRELPPVTCDLLVKLRGPKGFAIERHIVTMHNGASSGSQNYFYPDGLFILPRGGPYDLTLLSKEAPELFATRGAIVTFERWEDVGSALVWAFASVVGWCFILVAVVSLAVARLRTNSVAAA